MRLGRALRAERHNLRQKLEEELDVVLFDRSAIAPKFTNVGRAAGTRVRRSGRQVNDGCWKVGPRLGNASTPATEAWYRRLLH